MWLYLYLLLDIYVWSFICFYSVIQHISKHLNHLPNQSILKEINPEYSLEGLLLKMKLQYFDHLIWRVDWLEKTLMLKRTESKNRKGWDDEMVGLHHWLNGHEFEQMLRDSEGQESLACYNQGVAKNQTWLSSWTTTWVQISLCN